MIKVMEFLMTMGVIALVFIAATVVVALVAGSLIRLKSGLKGRTSNNVGSE